MKGGFLAGDADSSRLMTVLKRNCNTSNKSITPRNSCDKRIPDRMVNAGPAVSGSVSSRSPAHAPHHHLFNDGSAQTAPRSSRIPHSADRRSTHEIENKAGTRCIRLSLSTRTLEPLNH